VALFSKLLLAIDLSPESESLISRVASFCKFDVDQVNVVHVFKYGMHDSELLPSNLDGNPHAQRMLDHTTDKIREQLLRHDLDLPADRIFLVYGEPASEIKRLAADIDADLVIVGSHTKDDDWMQLPGTTTNCVLQGISSNVMAVKI
jgi:universal stress protein A|tara:strand:- start:20001 stop:20441 length:441 start_codon:yes stop_codon:yes gene_type:complete